MRANKPSNGCLLRDKASWLSFVLITIWLIVVVLTCRLVEQADGQSQHRLLSFLLLEKKPLPPISSPVSSSLVASSRDSKEDGPTAGDLQSEGIERHFADIKEDIIWHWQHGYVFDLRHYLAHESFMGNCNNEPMTNGYEINCILMAVISQSPYINLAARRGGSKDKLALNNTRRNADGKHISRGSIKWKEPILKTYEGNQSLGLQILNGGAFNQVLATLWGVGIARLKHKALIAPNFHSRINWNVMNRAKSTRLGFAGFFDVGTFRYVSQAAVGVPIVFIDLDERDAVFHDTYIYQDHSSASSSSNSSSSSSKRSILGDVLPAAKKHQNRLEVIGMGFSPNEADQFLAPTEFARLILSLVPERKLMDTIDGILEVLPVRFNAIHARLENDWNEVVEARESVNASHEDRVEAFLASLKSFGDTSLPIYLAGGNLPDEMIARMQTALGFQVYNKEVLKEKETMLPHFEIDQWAVIDHFVALHAIQWIAVTESSFSEMLHHRRVYIERACCKTKHVTYQSTQCLRESKRCDPSVPAWGVFSEGSLLAMDDDLTQEQLCSLYPRFTALHCSDVADEEDIRLVRPAIGTIEYNVLTEKDLADEQKAAD